MHIIQQAEINLRIKKALPSLVNLIKDIGAESVITGIETQAQLEIAIETGSHLLQGYYLGKPATAKALQPSKLFVNKPTTRVAA